MFWSLPVHEAAVARWPQMKATTLPLPSAMAALTFAGSQPTGWPFQMIALAGHSATHIPQAWHSAESILATSATLGMPNGHTLRHVRHAAHLSASTSAPP